MRDLGLGEYRSINKFVKAKLDILNSGEISFSSLFELMFSEKENVIYEKSVGYRILTYTYGQTHDSVLRYAAALKEALSGLEHGAVVGLYMENGIEWITAFWAIMAAGFCPLLMNMRLPEGVLEETLKEADVKAVVSDKKEFSVKTLLYGDIVVTDAALAADSFGDELYVMSSGTSEHIKVCAYSADELYYQIIESYKIICKCKQVKKHYDSRLKLLTFLPFYHIFGFIAVYIWFAFFSRTFVHLADMNPTTIVNTIKRHKVTHIFAVPLFWETVYDKAMKTVRKQDEKTVRKFERGFALSRKIGDVPVLGNLFVKLAFRPVREKLFGESVCFMITGGSMIRPGIMEFFNNIGYFLVNGYGATEIGITSVELSKKRKIRNTASVGEPFSCVEYKIAENGELLVRGKSLAKRIAEGKNEYSPSGWFNTHDLAECVGGRYYINGRHDDLIVSPGGENLNPGLIESYFPREGTGGVALITEGEKENARPLLLVSVKRTLSEKQFAAVDGRIRRTASCPGVTASIGKIVYISDPLLSENEFKLNRARLTREYNAGKLNVLTPESFKCPEEDENDLQLQKIKRMFAAALEKDPEEVRADSDFFLDEGGTSLEYFALMAELQEEFDTTFPTDGNFELGTVAKINDYVKAGKKHVD